MIELVFTACLVASPAKCEERHLTFAENMSPMQCLMGAQPQLAMWAAAHPKWSVSRFKCQRVRTASRDA